MAEAEGQVVVETERLVLRRELPGDLAIWLEHMNTPQVMACTGGVQPADSVAETFSCMAADGVDPVAFHFLERKADGLLVGKCGLSRIDTPVAPDELREAVQVGWTLRADCWGRGYAREAAQAALEVAFGRAGLTTVYSQTSERNTASWGLMKRLGMQRRADLDYHDPEYPPEDNPTMVWSISREAWRAARAREAGK
jgi:RimJ/RimL family protein N-acetyltransferase